MNGIHDMGGMHGFGPIERQDGEPVFHQPWEGRLLGMRLASPVRGSLRRHIERMDPTRYLASSYYEKWLCAFEQILKDSGLIKEEELEERVAFLRAHPDSPTPACRDADAARAIAQKLRAPAPPRLDSTLQARFAPGDRVRSRNEHPPGHTRLPRYVRGRQGLVTRYYGVYDIADEGAVGPQPLYSVRFDATELWGAAAEAQNCLYIDMWESYLEPV